MHFGSYGLYNGWECKGVCEPSPRYFFKFSRGSDRNRPGHQRINGNSLVCDSSSSLFSLFSGYHARNLAIILSHLNVIFFHIYSKISAVFLTMALLFRCLLAYRLKKRRMSACSSCFFLLAPTFFHLSTRQWQSDWAVFPNDAASRRLRAQPSVQSRAGWSQFC